MSHARGLPRREDFSIAVVCALSIESDPVEAAYAEVYDVNYTQPENDNNSYTTGRIGTHNVVLAYLPGMGKGISSGSAASMIITFPGIKLCLVVGICGGVPAIIGEDGPKDLLLADVVTSNEVLQYDRGQQLANRVVTVNTLQESLPRPNKEIQSFGRKTQGLTGRQRLTESTTENLEKLLKTKGPEAYAYPGADKDKLYEATYHHRHHDPKACNICDEGNEVCNDALESSCD